jgi:hypothetical protein
MRHGERRGIERLAAGGGLARESNAVHRNAAALLFGCGGVDRRSRARDGAMADEGIPRRRR